MSKNKEVREIEVRFKEIGAKKLLSDIESMTKAEIDASNKRISQMKKEMKAQEDIVERNVKWGKQKQKNLKTEAMKTIRRPKELKPGGSVGPQAPHYAHSKYKAQVNQTNQELVQLRKLKVAEEKKAKLVQSVSKYVSKSSEPRINKAYGKIDRLANAFDSKNKLGLQKTTYKGTKLKGALPFASPGAIFGQDTTHPAISKYVESSQSIAKAKSERIQSMRQRVFRQGSGGKNVQGASINEQHQNMMKDWNEAIKHNAKYDEQLAKEKKNKLANDIKQHKTQFKVSESVTAVEMLQYQAQKKEYEDSLSAGFKKAKAEYEAKKKAESLTPEQRLKAHKNTFKVSDSVTGAEIAQYQAQKKEYEDSLSAGFKKAKAEHEAKKKAQSLTPEQKLKAHKTAFKVSDDVTGTELAQYQARKKQEDIDLEEGFKAELARREEEAKAIEDKKKKLKKLFKFGQDRKFGIHEPRGATALVEKRKADAEQAGRDFLKARDAKRLNLGKQQQADYFARAKSNMKKYKDRQKANTAIDKASEGSISKFIDKSNGFGNAIVGMVGKLTLFVGAINMLGFTVTSVFAKIMQVGDKFAETQKTLMVGQGFRANLTNVQAIGFDRAVEAHRRATGLDSGTASAQMAMAGNTLSDMGGTLSERNLNSISMASRGAGALTNKDVSEVQSIIAEVVRSGKGADKLGLKKDLKLKGSIDDKLEQLLDAFKINPISGNAMGRSSISENMQGIRSVPNEIWSRVLGQHGVQASDIFSNLRDKFEFIFDKNDKDGQRIIDTWASVLTHFQKTVGALFTKDSIIKISDGVAQWSAELINIGGWFFKGFEWFLNNSETVIDTIKAIAVLWAGLKAFNMVRSVTQFFTLSKTISDGVKMTNWQLLQHDMGKMASGATSMFKNFGILAMGLAGAYMTYKDYNRGVEWSKLRDDIGETAGGIGFAIGGSGKGIANAFKNAGKGAMIGGAIGSVVPVVGTAVGMAVGAVIGGISGYLGGERIAEWTQSAFDSIRSGWESLGGYITNVWSAIIDKWLSVIDWVKDKVDNVKERLGIGSSGNGPLQYTDSNGKVYNRITKQFEDVSTPLSNTASVSNGIKLNSNFNQEEYNKSVTGGLFGMPNSKIIVINGGDLSIDSRVGATEEQFVGMAGS